MIDEIKQIWKYDPITITIIKSYIIPIIVIGIIITTFIIISNHEHIFNMGSHTYFSTGYPANGDASVFGADGYHFRNE